MFRKKFISIDHTILRISEIGAVVCNASYECKKTKKTVTKFNFRVFYRGGRLMCHFTHDEASEGYWKLRECLK